MRDIEEFDGVETTVDTTTVGTNAFVPFGTFGVVDRIDRDTGIATVRLLKPYDDTIEIDIDDLDLV